MKLVAYLRVSTKSQVEEGLGLEVQERTIKAWAKAAGHRVIDWCADEGISGAKGLEDRDGLADAIGLVREGKVAGIVVYRLDRLARDLILQEQILAEARRAGGEVFSTAASEAGYLGDDPDDPSRKLIRQILGAVNEYERSMIALRLRRGRRLKAQHGGYAFGSPHLGVESRDGELVPVDAERVVLDRIAALHGQGASLRTICAALEAEGHKTKRGLTIWQPTNVSRIVQRLATTR